MDLLILTSHRAEILVKKDFLILYIFFFSFLYRRDPVLFGFIEVHSYFSIPPKHPVLLAWEISCP